MNKDNIGQKIISFFIAIFFVIGVVFVFSDRDISKSVRNSSVQNVKKNPSPLNDRRSNNSGKDGLPKKNINEEKGDDKENEGEERNQNNYSRKGDRPSSPKSRDSNNSGSVKSSNSSGDPWILSFFKNIISSAKNIFRKKNKKNPTPLNDQNSKKRPNNSGKDGSPKNIVEVNINEEKDDDEEDDDDDEEYRNQNNYSRQRDNRPSSPQLRDSNNSWSVKSSNSSGDSWIFSFLKNIISFAAWLLTVFIKIIINVFFFFFEKVIMTGGSILFCFLLFIFAVMTIVKHIPVLNVINIPKKCYDFCSSQIGKIDFFSNHQNVKKYTDKFLKFVLRADSEAPAQGANNVNQGSGNGFLNFLNILNFFR